MTLKTGTDDGGASVPDFDSRKWAKKTIGPKAAKNGDNYSTALKRNMGRSAYGNLVQWMNL